MPNYAFKDLPVAQNGDKFTMYNLTRLQPHTAIFAGVTGLTFDNCNLTNCDLPPDAVIIGGQPRHREFCANLHPRWVAKGLPSEAENCPHVVDTDTITIDGEVVDTVYHYKDTTEAL